MSTIFCEAVLAQVYREKKNGELVGGPAYYIKNGLKNKWLAGFCGVLYFCTWNCRNYGTIKSVVQSLGTSYRTS